MLILAVESATPVAGVALMEDGRLLCEHYLDYRQTHSETLMPAIDSALNSCSRRADQLDLLAVSAGPGSFTGLRIGMAAAKGLALASGADIIGVPTLQALAMNAGLAGVLICTLLDARKQELYTGLWEQRDGRLIRHAPEQALPVSALGPWLAAALPHLGHSRVCCLGSGLASVEAELASLLGPALLKVPPHLVHPRASAVAYAAASMWTEGRRDDLYRLEPMYIRKSEAEYKLEQRTGKSC